MSAANKSWQNAILKRGETGEDSTTGLLKTVADHVIKGWSGVLDDEGEEVEFCAEAALELLTSMEREADWILDKLVAFVRRDENFCVSEIGPDKVAETTAKN